MPTEMREGNPKPIVSDPQLQRFVDWVYPANANVGSGSTAAAIRAENATGQPVHGSFHTQKGQNALTKCERWLQNNPAAAPGDRAAVENIMHDLNDALRYTTRPQPRSSY
jgi:hypothetical protein